MCQNWLINNFTHLPEQLENYFDKILSLVYQVSVTILGNTYINFYFKSSKQANYADKNKK